MLNTSPRLSITQSFSTLESGLYSTQSNLTIANTLTTDTGAYYCRAVLQVEGLARPVIDRVEGDLSILVQGKRIRAVIIFLYRS